MKKSILIAFAIVFVWLCSCEKNEPVVPIPDSSEGVFVVNEGGFGYGNSSLSYFDISTEQVENGIFSRANEQALGDVAQSMTIYNERGYLVVNNSGVVFIIDPSTYKVTGTIEGLTSPRYICFSNGKGYISDLYSAKITIFNPESGKIVGEIPTPSHPSTEEMVAVGNKLFVSCWSSDSKLLVIDTNSDTVIDSVAVGFQPQGLALDKNSRVWVLTSGNYYTSAPPKLYAVNSSSLKIEKSFTLNNMDFIADLQFNGSKDTIFFVNKGVWKMDIDSKDLPTQPFISYSEYTSIYALGVDPKSSEIYLADPIDYVQNGAVYRYTANGTPIDTFKVGICPGMFVFKR